MFSVTKIFFISLMVSMLTLNVSASEHENTDNIKVTEDIKYLSQKIANDYLYLYHGSNKETVRDSLQKNIEDLENNFRFLAKNTNNPDTKNILDFLSYNKDQIKEVIADDTTQQSASTMMDLSNTLLEGVDSILNATNHNGSQLRFHLMKISKLFMAINLGFDSDNNRVLLNKEMAHFEHMSTDQSWVAYKMILENKQNCFVPNIASILLKDLENKLGTI